MATLSAPPLALGLFGGTFAPIHNGHLRLAIELRERLALDRVLLVPNARPPHRGAPSVPAARRFQWLQLAVDGEPTLVADARELRRAEAGAAPSYTFDTLAELRAEQPDAALFLLVGDDAAAKLHSWHRWRELFALAHVVVIERPGEPAELDPELAAFLRGRRAPSVAALRERTHGLWFPVAIPPLAISSTRIRQLLAARRSIRGLVPEAVARSLTTEDVSALTMHEDPAHD